VKSRHGEDSAAASLITGQAWSGPRPTADDHESTGSGEGERVQLD
jgi:hypothetical protein